MGIVMVATLLIGVAFAPASGQNPRRQQLADSSAPRIIARAGTYAGASEDVRAMLRQDNVRTSQAKRDELADTLAAEAIAGGDRKTNAASFGKGWSALTGLALAGSTLSLAGMPYNGALARLIKIHKQSHGIEIRERALTYMLWQPDRASAISYLKTVAESTDPTATEAVRVLVYDSRGSSGGGPVLTVADRAASKQALADLASGHRVSDPDAIRLLQQWAR